MGCLNGSFDVAACEGENRSKTDGLQAVNSAFKATFRAHSLGGAEYVGCVASLHRGDYNCVEVQPQARFPIGAGDEE